MTLVDAMADALASFNHVDWQDPEIVALYRDKAARLIEAAQRDGLAFQTGSRVPDRLDFRITTLASAYAECEGRLEKFNHDKDLEAHRIPLSVRAGYYDGYMYEASELAVRLAKRGWEFAR